MKQLRLLFILCLLQATCLVSNAQKIQTVKDLKVKPAQGTSFDKHFSNQSVKETTPNNQARTEAIEIVGGRPIDIAEAPWQVALMVKSVGFQFCGGSIIDEYWIVTAAHCLEGATAEDIQVLAGSSSVVEFEDGQLVDVAEIIMHPEYSDVATGYDIALLRLAVPLDLSAEKAQKIAYATSQDEASGLTDEGVLSIISGWGTLSEGGSSPDILYAADIPIVSNETANSLDYNGLVTETMLAAGDIVNGGIDACQGDSGGPLVVPNKAGNGYVLAGVTSWGFGCANPSSPGLYARVAFFADWIEENSGVANNEFPQLFISEVVSGTETDNLPEYIEIYNASDEAYALGDVAIQLLVAGQNTITINLPDYSLKPEKTYVISKTAFNNAWGGLFASVSPDLVRSDLTLANNPVIRLVHATQLYAIDQLGSEAVNADEWNYTGKIATRKSFIVFGNAGVFTSINVQEWLITAYTAAEATPGSHEATLPENDAALIGFSIQNNQTFVLCNDEFELAATMTIRNTGGDSIRSLQFRVTAQNETNPMEINFEDPVPPGASRQVELPILTFNMTGTFVITAEIISVNNEDDGNPVNNLKSVAFKLVEGYKTTFAMTFDENPSENAFLILDSLKNNIVHFGNGGEFFEGFEEGGTYTEEVCLQQGFYSFLFVDAVDISFGVDPGEGLLPPGEASFVINSVEHGDITVAEISGEFDDGILYYGFKLPYEEILDAQVKIRNPIPNAVKYSCDLDLTMNVQVVNVNSLPVTGFELIYGETGQDSLLYVYEGEPLLSGDVVDLTFQITLSKSGEVSVFANLTKINEDSDDAAENNEETVNFTYEIPEVGNTILLEFYVDSWPEEASWEITDANGLVVNSGFFGEADADEIVTIPVCLPDGTFTLTIFDSYGDGGTAVIAYNEEDAILFILTPDFFSSTSYSFELPYLINLDAAITLVSPLPDSEITLCSDDFDRRLVLEIENKSNVPIYELTLEYSSENGSGQFQYVVGQNDQFFILPDEKIQIGIDVTLVEGINIFEYTISQINETPVVNISGESTLNVVFDQDLHSVDVRLTTDFWPEETSFTLTHLNDDLVIAEENTFPANTTINYPFCLVDGNYTFRLFDSFSDGGASVNIRHAPSGHVLGSISADSYTSSASKSFCLGCLDAPSQLTPTMVTHQSITMEWQDNSVNESGFILYRSTNGDTWTEIQRLAANTVTATDNNVAQETEYWYAVMAFINITNGISGFSNILQVSTKALGLSPKEANALYPNPVKSGSQLHIDLSEWGGNGSFSIVDISGRVVVKEQPVTSPQMQLDLAGWKAGIYYFRFEIAGKKIGIPFIIND